MGFFSRFNPKTGAVDFWSEFSRPQPYRWPILGVSTLLTFGLIFAFTQERVVLPPEKPTIEYITSYAANRTDEEIRASNLENQRRKDERAARLAAREERRKELYRALGRASGMDVDQIERQIAEEEAAAASAQAAADQAARDAADAPAANSETSEPDS